MVSSQLSYTSIHQGFISQNMPTMAHCNDSQHPKHALYTDLFAPPGIANNL